MFNQYSSITSTFIAKPILNQLWNNLSNSNAGAGAGVTLGTDDWFPQQADFQQSSFHDREGLFASLSIYQNKHENPFFRTFTPWCNFADGLVEVTDVSASPTTNIGDTAAQSNYNNALAFRIIAAYVNASDEIVSNGTFDIPFMGWNVPVALDLQSPQVLTTLRNLGEANVEKLLINIIPLVTGDPAFSTVTIDTGFQAKRCLCWATLDIEHTFATSSSPT